MSSTFFGLTIAGSALSSFQTAINTSANNISNVQTEGYTKQVANRVASEALRVNQKYGTTGTGVTTTSITQLRDEYYDVKYRENNSKVGYYTKKLWFMNQAISYFTDDDTQEGFSTVLNKMFNAMTEVQGSGASDTTLRQQFIGTAQNLATYFNNVSEELSSLQSSCNEEVKTTVNQINSIAQKVSVLNKQINQIEISGGYANELRDERANLVDELSAIVPVTATEADIKDSNNPDRVTGATWYTLTVNGQTLVDNYNYRTLECQARDTKVNQSDVDGLFDIYWSDNKEKFDVTNNSMDGELKGLMEMRDGNNRANFQGKVTGVTANSVTIAANLSITSVYEMNMAEEGVIKIGNTEFNYSDFSYTTTTDSDGNETITSYTFNLTDTDAYAMGDYMDKSASIGESIDAMGVPYYQDQLNAFLRSFASKFNQIEEKGVDLNGDEMGAFFVANMDYDEKTFDDYSNAVAAAAADSSGSVTTTYNVTTSTTTSSDSYYWLTAANFSVASASVKDPAIFATILNGNYTDGVDGYDIVTELLKLKSDTKIYRSSVASDFLQCLITDITVDTEEAETFQSNYSNISETIVAQRNSVSGVDEDEEALDLVKFQNAYNLASKMVSVMADMYDQLILNTGV